MTRFMNPKKGTSIFSIKIRFIEDTSFFLISTVCDFFVLLLSRSGLLNIPLFGPILIVWHFFVVLFSRSGLLNIPSFGPIWTFCFVYNSHDILSFSLFLNFLFLGEINVITKDENKINYVRFQMSPLQFLKILMINQLIIYWIQFFINLSLQFMKNQY